MEYRRLGQTSLDVSAIAYGAFAMGGTMWGGNEEKDSIASVQAAIDNGVTTIDTAPFYGLGLSEELIGKAIKGYDRSKIQILTKFGLVWDGSNKGKGDYFFDLQDKGRTLPVYKLSSRDNIIREVEASLRRLGTDYIDLLQQHWPDATTPIGETMEAMEALIRQGKIRAAGVSNYNVDQLEEAAAVFLPASNQVYYSMLHRNAEQDLVPYVLSKGMSLIAYSPMERGLLSGKYFKGETLKGDDHRHGYFERFNLERVQQFLEEIAPIAEAHNSSLAQLVLRWTSLQPGIATVLAGARNAAQAEANAGAMNIQLTSEELQRIHDALALV